MSAGSYDPARTSGAGLADELARLEAQARLSFDDELRILHSAGIAADGVLLEIGAGSGAVTRRLRAALPEARLVALDVDGALLRHAAGAADALVVADGCRLPLADASVDTVLLRYVLQHVADPAAMLVEVRRVLRPGGRAVLVDIDSSCWGAADPNYPELGRVHGKIASAQQSAGGDRTIGRRLTRLLTAAGFTAVALQLSATTSDERPREDFAAHLGPERLQPLVAAGVVSLADLALATQRWRRFLDDPDFWVVLISFVAYATKP